jgi:hypothetical protein
MKQAAQMNGLGERLCYGSQVPVEKHAGKIRASLDIARIGGLLKCDSHLIDCGDERITDNFEPNQIRARPACRIGRWGHVHGAHDSILMGFSRKS